MNLDQLNAIPTYAPNLLLNHVAECLGAKNDAALSRKLGVTSPIISRMRHKKLGIGSHMLIRMHDATGLSINALRKMMGVPTVDLPVPAEA